jgi:hypothetical protein
MFARPQRVDGRVVREQLSRQCDSVYLRWAIGESDDEGLLKKFAERQLGGNAEGTMDLNCPHHHVMENLRSGNFDGCNLFVISAWEFLVNQPGGVENEKTKLLYLDP